uniref:G protein-coupled receptor n=1 Tax=Steinernema glaseri TaxID=37863 RepID=A0A1I7Z6T1_9BILA
MFSVLYTIILTYSYAIASLASYISWSVSTPATRRFTWFLTVGKALNCLLLFVWNVVLQPEFLEEIMCLRMHGIASNFSKYEVHLCVCVAIGLIGIISVYNVHFGIYNMLAFCSPDMEKNLFSAIYLAIFFLVYLLDLTFEFSLVHGSINLQAFPTENSVVCYTLSSKHVSKYVAISSCVLVGFKAIVATVLLALLRRFLRKIQTEANKKKVRAVIRTLVILSLVPTTMAAIPFAAICIWALCVSSSPALALFSNVASYMAMLHYSVLCIAAIFLFEPFRCAFLRIVLRKNVVQAVVIRTTNVTD